MATTIEWTDDSWNPVRGCDKISPGCKNCYAERFAERWRGVPGHAYEQGFDLRLVPHKLGEPFGWRKPKRVFVNSMSDLFHEGVPFEYVAAVLAVVAACPDHTFQVLTKRPERLLAFFEWLAKIGGAPVATCAYHLGGLVVPKRPFTFEGVPWPLPNLWLGVSVEDQKSKARVGRLRRAPAQVRFLSLEPLLEDLGELDLAGIGWVIVGGESGHGARPCFIHWIRSIVVQCRLQGVPVFVKQLGSHAMQAHLHAKGIARELGVTKKGGDPDEWPADLRVREWPRAA